MQANHKCQRANHCAELAAGVLAGWVGEVDTIFTVSTDAYMLSRQSDSARPTLGLEGRKRVLNQLNELRLEPAT